MENLNISTKVLIPIILLMIFGNGLNTYFSTYEMKNITSKNQVESINMLGKSIFQSLRIAMDTGDSTVIKKAEEEARAIKGVEKLVVAKSKKIIELFGLNESFTNDKNILKAFQTKKKFKFEEYEDNGKHHHLKIVTPMMATSECITCHTNQTVGDVLGVIELTYSLDATDEHISSVTIQLILSTILLIVMILSVVFFVVKKNLSPLKTLNDDLKTFFDYISYKRDSVESFKIVANDEIGQIVSLINTNIQEAKQSIQKDRDAVNDISDVLEKVKNGFFDYKVDTNASNPNINNIKDNLNNMMQDLSKSFDTMRKVLIEYGNANYSYNVDLGNASGAIGSLLLGTRSVGSGISEFIATIDIASQELQDDVQILSSSSESLSTASNQQAASLEETAAALEEISSNTQANSHNIHEMTEYANNLRKSVEYGHKLADQTSISMDEINDQVSLINDAIDVIDQIAFQTNILSLNAAVEAATAGEAGKGFAVVAQEVRNLAGRSAQAANEIKDLVEKATLKANEGKNISTKMIEGYNGLNKDIDKTLDTITIVTNASQEQLVGIEQISHAVNELDQVTQINAASASQINNLAQHIEKLSTKLHRLVDNASYDERAKEQVCDVDMVFELNKLKLNHISFKDTNFAKVGSKTTWKVTSENECALGHWITKVEQENQNFTKTDNWKHLKDVHKKVHQGVQKYIDQNAKNVSNDELKLIANRIESDISDIFWTIQQVKRDHCK